MPTPPSKDLPNSGTPPLSPPDSAPSSPPEYTTEQPHNVVEDYLNPHHIVTADFEIADGTGVTARRRSTANQARPRPEFVLPNFPASAKQGRPTVIRELSYSTPTTPSVQTPYTQTPISTQPPSPAPLLSHKDTEKQLEFPAAPDYRTIYSLSSWRGILILSTTCGAQLMDNVFMTGVNISLPTIQKELNVSTADLQWLISAYTLTFGGFLLLAGVLSDRYGKKNMFVAGMAWLSIWTIANGFAQSFVSLAIFRALQGIGAALTVPSAVGVITTSFDPKDRNKALSLFGASGAVGFSVGLIFGGLLTGTLGWRYTFRIAVAITGMLACSGVLFLPQDHPIRKKDRPAASTQGPRPRLDLLGAAISTSGLILLSFVLSSGGVYGWKKAFIIVLLIGSIALLVFFTWVEKKVPNPIMPLGLWKTKNFGALWIYSFVIYSSYQSMVYYLTLVAQDVNKLSAKDTAIRFLPMGATGFFVSFLMGRIVSMNINIKLLLLLGSLICMSAPIPCALMTEGNIDFWSQVFPSSILAVAGVSVGYNVVTVVMMASVPAGSKSLCGGMINTAFQIGSGVGLALSSAVVQAVDTSKGHGVVDQYATGLWCCVGFAGLGLVAVAVGVKTQKGVVH